MSENIPITKSNVIRKEFQPWAGGEWNTVYVCRGCGLKWTMEYHQDALDHHCPVKDAVYGKKD